MTAAVRERATSSDFDFLMGKWHVHNRRLAERLAGSDEWDEFPALVAARPLPGGLGNEDVFCTPYAGGFVGMSFRFFDPETKLWSIWEQAFSDDGGATWETNWTMDFTRALEAVA